VHWRSGDSAARQSRATVLARPHIQLRDRTITLGPAEMYIVPKGVEHRPVALEEVHAPDRADGTPNTGQADGGAAKNRIAHLHDLDVLLLHQQAPLGEVGGVNRDFLTPFFIKRHSTAGLASCQAYRSSVWNRSIVGPFIGPRRYISECFGVSGGRRPRGMIGSGR
jgi:hypothetical protein